MVMLKSDFGPYGLILMNVCSYNRCHGNAVTGFWALQVITVAMVILLGDFGLYGMILMTMCVYYFTFSHHS
jgi:hypothetical protein